METDPSTVFPDVKRVTPTVNAGTMAWPATSLDVRPREKLTTGRSHGLHNSMAILGHLG